MILRLVSTGQIASLGKHHWVSQWASEGREGTPEVCNLGHTVDRDHLPWGEEDWQAFEKSFVLWKLSSFGIRKNFQFYFSILSPPRSFVKCLTSGTHLFLVCNLGAIITDLQAVIKRLSEADAAAWLVKLLPAASTSPSGCQFKSQLFHFLSSSLTCPWECNRRWLSAWILYQQGRLGRSSWVLGGFQPSGHLGSEQVKCLSSLHPFYLYIILPFK